MLYLDYIHLHAIIIPFNFICIYTSHTFRFFQVNFKLLRTNSVAMKCSVFLSQEWQCALVLVGDLRPDPVMHGAVIAAWEVGPWGVGYTSIA